MRHVADVLDCHVNTVLRYLEEGKLKGHNPNGPGVKGLRITVESLEKFIKKYSLKEFNKDEFDKELMKLSTKKKKRSRRPGQGFARNY